MTTSASAQTLSKVCLLAQMCIYQVGQNHAFTRKYSVHTVILAGNSPYMRLYTASIHGSGQLFVLSMCIPLLLGVLRSSDVWAPRNNLHSPTCTLLPLGVSQIIKEYFSTSQGCAFPILSQYGCQSDAE